MFSDSMKMLTVLELNAWLNNRPSEPGKVPEVLLCELLLDDSL
jgi:hypothetical protein